MSLLTIVQNHCKIHGLNIPTGIIASLDSTVIQLLAMLNELLDLITDQSQFQGFTREALFNWIAAEDQGAIGTIADEGFLWIHNDTFFDRTLKRPVYGPLNDEEWQWQKAVVQLGPWYKYRIRENRLLVLPTPAAPLSEVAFEYASSFGVLDNDGVTYKQYFTEDTDTFALPEKILLRGLSYRWKQIKGLEYLADEQQFWNFVNNAVARDGGKPTYNMAHDDQPNIKPGIMIPLGSWNV